MESSVSHRNERPVRIALVAGEESGDILGSGLMRELKQLYPRVEFRGVGGRRMTAEGLESLFPMERLSVMGLVEVLKRLPELLRRRKRLVQELLDWRPDLFVGIDAPDFNLGVERALKRKAVPTVHYVSPSVWAWRQKRLDKIEEATDLMLCFLPFEARFYAGTSVDAQFIGHPLASQLPLPLSRQQAKEQLGLSSEKRLVALMPGSRRSEVEKLAPDFIETANWLARNRTDLQFVIPAANEARYQQLTELLAANNGDARILLVASDSQRVLAASDAVLIASGTATLEAMLSGCPMVVAYRMAGLTYKIISRMLRTPFVSLPNLLANERLVPELFQDQVRAEVLGPLLLRALDDQAYRAYLQTQFAKFSAELRMDADQRAALAVQKLLEERRG